MIDQLETYAMRLADTQEENRTLRARLSGLKQLIEPHARNLPTETLVGIHTLVEER